MYKRQGENIPKPGIPESFKVLVKELQSLALDIRIMSGDDSEIDIKEDVDLDEVSIEIKEVIGETKFDKNLKNMLVEEIE